MSNIDKKIKKICKRLEKDFEAEVVCGKTDKGESTSTIPVSIRKVDPKNKDTSPYSLPIGLIQIDGKKVRFVSIEKRQFFLKTVLKIILLIIGILGIKSLFKSKKKWDSN